MIFGRVFEQYRQPGLTDFNRVVAAPIIHRQGGENIGTLILDATCVPRNISFPQDLDILNEARENQKGIIITLLRLLGNPVF